MVSRRQRPVAQSGLAPEHCRELARLTTLEMECLVSGSARADSINELLKPFIADLRIPVEYGCALGGVLFRPYLDLLATSRSMWCRGIASVPLALTAPDV